MIYSSKNPHMLPPYNMMPNMMPNYNLLQAQKQHAMQFTNPMAAAQQQYMKQMQQFNVNKNLENLTNNLQKQQANLQSNLQSNLQANLTKNLPNIPTVSDMNLSDINKQAIQNYAKEV